MITEEQVGNCFTTLSYNKEIICVIPTEYVDNVKRGLQRLYEIARNESTNSVYNEGYRDGLIDIIGDLQMRIDNVKG